MDQSAIRFVRWSWVAGILLLEPVAARAQSPEEPPVRDPGVQPSRVAAPDVSSHGPHASRQDDRLSREFRRAAARPLRQRTIHRTGRQGRPASIHSLPQRFPARNEPVLADRGIAFQHHGDANAWLAGSDHHRMDSRAARTGPGEAPGDCRDPEAIQASRSWRIASSSPHPPIRVPWVSRRRNNFGNTIIRSQMSAPAFPLPPTESAAMGVR